MAYATARQIQRFAALPDRLNPRQFAALRRNIVNNYNSASPEVRSAGRDWYQRGHEEAAWLADHYAGQGVEHGAGVMAALSPQTGWDLNRHQAHQLYQMDDRTEARVRGGDRSPLAGTPLTHHPSEFIVKALNIRNGSADPVTSFHKNKQGRIIKVGNFQRNLAHPDDPDAVTIDTHAHDVARGAKYPYETDRGLSGMTRYDHFADAYRGARDRLGLQQTHQVQATTWVNWRLQHPGDRARMDPNKTYAHLPSNPRKYGFS